MYRQEPLARDAMASWEKGRGGGSYRGTLEIVSPFNYHDGVENHTQPIVEGFFDSILLPVSAAHRIKCK